jgi:hypothetical protein
MGTYEKHRTLTRWENEKPGAHSDSHHIYETMHCVSERFLRSKQEFCVLCVKFLFILKNATHAITPS